MCTGFEIASLVLAVAGSASAAYSSQTASRKARHAQQDTAASLKSLAPPPAPIGPSAADLESKRVAAEATKAKAAAEKRAETIEAGIKADTETAATRRRSLVGLSSTIKTSAKGLTGLATVEKKTLLGQGGLA